MPPDLAGDVYVETNGNKSNVVPLTEWKGQFRQTRHPVTPPFQPLTITITCDVHFRADIQGWSSIGVHAVKGPKCRWQGSGSVQDDLCIRTFSGSGERIYDGGTFHDYYSYIFTLIWDIYPQEKKVNFEILFSEYVDPVIGTTICLSGFNYKAPYSTAIDENILLNLDGNFAVEAGIFENYFRRIEWDRIEPKYVPNIHNTPAM